MLITSKHFRELVFPCLSYDRASQIQDCEDDRKLNLHFSQLVQQRIMRLPIAPFRSQYPNLDQWLDDVEFLAPELLIEKRKLLLDAQIRAGLVIEHQRYWIEISANLGFRQGIPRLYEWGVRSDRFTWQDKLKLWAVSKSFGLRPNQLQMILIAASSNAPTTRRKYQWNRSRHRKTERALTTLLTSALYPQPESERQSSEQCLAYLDTIPEIAL